MAKSDLNVVSREVLGKGGSRSLRRQGLVPATVYGHGMEPCSITVEPKALKTAIATEAGLNTLITLRGEGAFDGKVVILKETQVDPIRRDVTHADFQAIDVNAKIQVVVPIHVVGKCVGEALGGSLQSIRHELEVLCAVDSIPGAIEVDVTALNIGDVLHVEDIVLPEGVEAPHDANFTVITVIGRKAEAEEEEGEEEAAAE